MNNNEKQSKGNQTAINSNQTKTIKRNQHPPKATTRNQIAVNNHQKQSKWSGQQ